MPHIDRNLLQRAKTCVIKREEELRLAEMKERAAEFAARADMVESLHDAWARQLQKDLQEMVSGDQVNFRDFRFEVDQDDWQVPLLLEFIKDQGLVVYRQTTEEDCDMFDRHFRSVVVSVDFDYSG